MSNLWFITLATWLLTLHQWPHPDCSEARACRFVLALSCAFNLTLVSLFYQIAQWYVAAG